MGRCIGKGQRPCGRVNNRLIILRLFPLQRLQKMWETMQYFECRTMPYLVWYRFSRPIVSEVKYFSPRRIVKKIPKLQKDQKELLEEWKDRSSRFDKSLKKTEEKLKEQISIGREVSIWVRHTFLLPAIISGLNRLAGLVEQQLFGTVDLVGSFSLLQHFWLKRLINI